jgi:hypothetical protein
LLNTSPQRPRFLRQPYGMTSFLRRTECMVFTLLTFHPLVPFPERLFPTNLGGISANNVHPSQSGWFWARDSEAPAESGEFVVRRELGIRAHTRFVASHTRIGSLCMFHYRTEEDQHQFYRDCAPRDKFTSGQEAIIGDGYDYRDGRCCSRRPASTRSSRAKNI